MSNGIIIHECEWCGIRHKTKQEAIKCLNSHDIVFGIDELVDEFDSWGGRTMQWVHTNLLFKTYESACEHCDSGGLRVVCIPLNE
jgi:hypothetical protein